HRALSEHKTLSISWSHYRAFGYVSSFNKLFFNILDKVNDTCGAVFTADIRYQRIQFFCVNEEPDPA
ncbi:hypothetical protein, partial [Atlantibacter hermannii]|uniref:hypothetical protein n=1 Tax=Atlantibacter hermannii TaxID=565 RepID=UPI0028AE6C9C